MGNKTYEPNARHAHDVKLLSGFGVQQKHIAAHLGMDEKTLRKYYREELDAGKASAIAEAARRLFQLVQKDNLTAIIFFLKTQAGFSEKVDLTNSDGTLQPRTKVKRIVVNSTEELEAFKAAAVRAASEGRDGEDSDAVH